jgi:hypothetical protein
VLPAERVHAADDERDELNQDDVWHLDEDLQVNVRRKLEIEPKQVGKRQCRRERAQIEDVLQAAVEQPREPQQPCTAAP